MEQTPLGIRKIEADPGGDPYLLVQDLRGMADEIDGIITGEVTPLKPAGTTMLSGDADAVTVSPIVVPAMSAALAIDNLPVKWPGVLETLGTGAAKYQTFTPTFIGANAGTGANLPPMYHRRVNQAGGWREWTSLGGSTASTREGALRLDDMRLRVGPVRVTTPVAVTIVMDHGLTNVKSKVLSPMRARGLTATLAINSGKWADDQNSGASQADVQGWVDVFEIANHGRNHLLTGADSDRDEIIGGRTELESQLGLVVDTFVQTGNGAPGSYDFNDGRTAKAYWETATGRAITESHAVWTGLVPNPTSPTYPMDGNPRPGAMGLWLDTATSTAEAAITTAIAAGRRRIMLRIHPQFLDTAGYITTAQLTAFLDFLVARRAAGEVTVLTYRQWSLAEAVAAHKSSLTLPGGVKVTREGSTVHVSFYGALPGGTGTVEQDTLPVGYRPAQHEAGIYFQGGVSTPPGRVHLLSNGVVRYYAVASAGASTTMSGTFATADPAPA